MAPDLNMTSCLPPPPPIVIKKSTAIMPLSPSMKRPLFLSSLDIHWREFHYNKRILFYPNIITTTNCNDAIETLKTSLSAMLVHYYPWAGRLALDAQGRLIIDCNDAGVEFMEASLDFQMREISREGFPMMPLYDSLCRPVDHTGDRLYTSPLLSIQVTWFSDGGMSLGISLSHVVADGKSLWNFMVAWGECAMGKVGTTPPPIHERERLALNGPPSEDVAKRYTAKLERSRDRFMENGGSNHVKLPKRPAMETGLMQCVFVLSESSIKKLKEEAGGRYTSYEVLCAHFWRQVTQARLSPPGTKVRFMVMANLRAKLDPPLPPSYFGNVLDSTSADARADDVLSEGLGHTAQRIHEAVLMCTHDSLVANLHWLELRGNSSAEARKDWAEFDMLGPGSSPRFPVYDVEFGWGRPAAVRSAKLLGDGEMVLFGGREGSLGPGGIGDIEIGVALPSHVMERLLNDPTFLAEPMSNPFHYYK